jgi:SMC interacting uncharacterized protein involved in chromosome segregation
MKSSAERLAEDLLVQIRDENAATEDAINQLRGQLQNQVSINQRLALRTAQLTQEVRALRRDANGEPGH